jgi:hypothetical protein
MSERADPKTCLKPAIAGFRQLKVNLNKRKLQIIVVIFRKYLALAQA